MPRGYKLASDLEFGLMALSSTMTMDLHLRARPGPTACLGSERIHLFSCADRRKAGNTSIVVKRLTPCVKTHRHECAKDSGNRHGGSENCVVASCSFSSLTFAKVSPPNRFDSVHGSRHLNNRSHRCHRSIHIHFHRTVSFHTHMVEVTKF